MDNYNYVEINDMVSKFFDQAKAYLSDKYDCFTYEYNKKLMSFDIMDKENYIVLCNRYTPIGIRISFNSLISGDVILANLYDDKEGWPIATCFKCSEYKGIIKTIDLKELFKMVKEYDEEYNAERKKFLLNNIKVEFDMAIL